MSLWFGTIIKLEPILSKRSNNYEKKILSNIREILINFIKNIKFIIRHQKSISVIFER